MISRKAIYISFVLVLALTMIMPAAWADVQNQETQLTFSAPVHIPGNMVLPAGTYWFVLAEPTANYNIIRVYDANRSLVATTMTIPTERTEPFYGTSTDAWWNQTALTFAQGSRYANTLVKWFYPGDKIGHEFVYSGNEGRALSEEPAVTIMVRSGNNSSGSLSASAKY